ncbi:MAG TPA: YceI family protein [Gemmatimonadales bacterium]|nr:YceI family protein [Gemmatimonadales bacterium]
MARRRLFHIRCLPGLISLLVACVAAVAAAPAQTRWTIDPKASLAWWQMDPHLNHLWATTCPQEPSWRPGEGRSAGWYIDQMLRPSKTGFAAVSDTVHIPLYPRHKVRSVCPDAVVEGEVMAQDTARWQGIRGQVTVKGEALITGENRRDAFARKAVLETTRYPEIRFTVDSLVGVTRQSGDTLRGTAVGVFSLHGVTKPVGAAFRAWPEAGGVRVLAKFHVPASSLVGEFGLSNYSLGLGVGTRVWKDLFMGVDLLLRPEGSGAGK